ncbi:protein GAMETE EXPRESSED 3 isoform X3 [Andrographis paniculata]|nr:protein GAMETE EXPRESSED 3 isoform X3 [Andrographis paniculata]
MWSAGPVLYRHGYRQGCRKNITKCYFTSMPIIDHCEASIFVLNTVGELYSLSVHGPNFKWIQDLSSYGNTLAITPGNNGLLYVTVPESALVLALNASTGNILWQGSFGPLSSIDNEPVVDANGWISFGSLDGHLYSFSPTGDLRKFPRSPSLDSVIQVNPVLDCSGYALYTSTTKMEGKSSHTIAEYTYVSALKPKNVVFTLLVPASSSVYWSESDPSKFLFKLSQTDLQLFVLDERTLLSFFAASRIGSPFPCSYKKLESSCLQVEPESEPIYTGNGRTIIMFLAIESVALLLLAGAVRFCCIFWKKKKVQDQNLGKFLDKRRSLQSQEKALDHMITELQRKASEDANGVLETLSDLVRGREDIRRRLSTTYSLGRDTNETHPNSKSRLLPLYEGTSQSHSQSQSHSLEGVGGGSSVSISQTQSSSSSGEYSKRDEFMVMLKAKGKAVVAEEEEEGESESEATSNGGRREEMEEVELPLIDDDDEEKALSLKSTRKGRRRSRRKSQRYGRAGQRTANSEGSCLYHLTVSTSLCRAPSSFRFRFRFLRAAEALSAVPACLLLARPSEEILGIRTPLIC